MSHRGELPRLHLVTDDAVVRRPGFASAAAELMRTGGERMALHLRGPSLTGAALHARAAALRVAARESGARLIVNDRVDIALAIDADGAQVGARGLHARDARRLLGDRWLGVSVHSAAEGTVALAAGADFVLAGTLYPSGSHPGRAGSGVHWLGAIEEGAGRVIGIGGIRLERVGEVLAAGAHGVAVLGAVWREARPAEALMRIVQELYER